jgi:hypothetical protein
LSYLNSDIDTWLLSSHNTIRNWVIEQCKDQKDVEADLIVDLKTDIEQEKAALEKAVEA